MDFGDRTGANNVVCALSSGTSGQPTLYVFNESGAITGSVTSPSVLTLNTWTHLAFAIESPLQGLGETGARDSSRWRSRLVGCEAD